MRPLLERLSNQYKGPASSDDYNNLRETLYFDILRLYDIAARNQVKINSNMNALMSENYFMQNKIRQLEDLLTNLELSLSSQGKVKYLRNTFNSGSNFSYDIPGVTIPADKRLKIDTLNGIGTLPVNASYNKIYLTDNHGEKFLPDSFVVEVEEGTSLENLEVIEDKSVYNAFDGKRLNFWFRRIKRDVSAQNIYSRITLKLPLNIVNNAFANSISIHPCPEFSMSLLSIEYKDIIGVWKPILDDEINELTKSKFIFSELEMTDVRITLKQPHWSEDNNERVFTYGLQSIEVAYEEYLNIDSSIISVFNLERFGSHVIFSRVNKPIVVLFDESIASDNVVSHNIYADFNETGIQEVSFENTSDFDARNCSKVYVVTSVGPQGNITPTIKSIDIEFKTGIGGV